MGLLLSIFAVILGAAGIVGSFVPVLPGVIPGYAGILCAFFREGSSLSLTSEGSSLRTKIHKIV